MSAPVVRRQVSRDLGAARSAYARNDAAASARAHGSVDAGRCSTSEGGHANSSNDAGAAVREEVLKALWTGLTSTLLLSSVLQSLFSTRGGANALTFKAQLVAYVAYALSGSFVWAVNARLKHRIKSEVYDRERKRESWELRNYKEGEVREIIELYEERGMSREDAEACVLRMAGYHEFFVDVMMAEELALVKPIPLSQTPWRFLYAGVSFFAAVVGPIVLGLGTSVGLDLLVFSDRGDGGIRMHGPPPSSFFPAICLYGMICAVTIGYQNSLANMLQSNGHVLTHVAIAATGCGMPQICMYISQAWLLPLLGAAGSHVDL